MQYLATILFALAVLHTFSVKRFQHWARKYPEGSVRENIFHFLGEVEVVFGVWALALCTGFLLLKGNHQMVEYLEGRNYTEPAFVFVIMTMAATRPVLVFATKMITAVASKLPWGKERNFYVAALIVGPLLGSFITEPAAMTVTAMVVLKRFYEKGVSKRFKYMTLGLLFVNVSIGGTLTHFAAPPVLMVAHKWNLGMVDMFTMLGWKAIVSIVLGTLGTAWVLKGELAGMKSQAEEDTGLMDLPWWMFASHLLAIGLVVVYAHHMVVFLGIFLFFLAWMAVTQEYQEEPKLRESILVGFFLAGLVTLGGLQQWWLQPLLESMGAGTLFVGTTALTAVTDNAALTYLGSLVEGLASEEKRALLAGAVSGGGLTVIANAPNPAGFAILQGSFGKEGISPLGLLAAAFPYTLIAMACLWLLP